MTVTQGWRLRAFLCLSASTIFMPFAAAHAEDASATLSETVVTGTREGELRSETPASVSVIGEETINEVKPAHPSEVMNRVPGVAIMQTNGEGHITGIRQPIGTAPVYLYLEDGIPIRSTGFFNHNALYEVDVPQAGAIEVTRGPGTALQGSEAIGGIVNVLTKAPSLTPEASVSAEAGSYGWYRGLASASSTWGDLGARGDLNLTHSDGWRDKTAYDRQAATLRADQVLSGDATIKAILSATNINQQTGAVSTLNYSDYLHNPTTNYTPIAFREVDAVRGSVAYDKEDETSLISLTPYFRYDHMRLLPSWQLTYDPVVYDLDNESLGLQAKYRRDFAPWRTRLIVGTDFDFSPGSYSENSISVTKSGNVFTSYTLGAQRYDYDVTFMQASPYVYAETSPITDLRFDAGVRLDMMSYDYDNHLGTLELSGYKWQRPASQTREFSHLGPSVGATYSFIPELNAFANYKNSFRAPTQSELFRQGKNDDSIHLQPIEVDSYEAGLRGPDKGDLTWETSVYRMTKHNDILTASDGVTPTATNNGSTRHEGVEAALNWKFVPDWHLGASGTYARHTYIHWVSNSGDFSGKDINTAPRLIGDVTLGWTPRQVAGLRLEGEWTHLGSYWMDDTNQHKYGGHDLFNLRGSYTVADGIELFARIMNLADARWATDATVINGQAQYAPGLPRTYYGGITAKF